MWNFQIEIYCILALSHGIIAALVTMLFLPLFPQPAAYVFQNTSEQLSHDFLFMACWNFVGSLLCHFLIFCRIGNAENRKRAG